MADWQLQDAKNRLSEVVKRARQQGPQTVTVHGQRAAVIMSSLEFDALVKPRMSFVDFLLSDPTGSAALAGRCRRRDQRPQPGHRSRYRSLMYLLDTCVVSEARRRTPQAVAWLRTADPETLFLSALTIGEIMKGIMLKMPSDPQTAARLLRWLDELRFVYANRILPIDDAVAASWGRLMAQRSRPVADALMAATAQVNNKVLVTRNVSDTADAGIAIIDPWTVMP